MEVRPVSPTDEAAWKRLFRAYRSFYFVPEDEEVVHRVWTWVLDPDHEVQSFVTVDEGQVVAIANYRVFARPLHGSSGLWLDDLITDPSRRGRGAAGALISELRSLAAREDRQLVRWITSDHNHSARRVYDRVATATQWVVYDCEPASPSSR